MYTQLVDKIDQSLYVDDLVSGGANVQEVYELYKAAKHIMYQGGFNLWKWNSNSSELLRLIHQAEHGPFNSVPTNFLPVTGTLVSCQW